jgi:hypothetical protein
MAYPFPFVAGNILTAAELNALGTLGVPVLGFESTQYYTGAETGRSNALIPNQQVQWTAFFVSDQTTFDRMAVRTSASFAGSGTIRLGIYNNDTVNAKPSTVALDAGTVVCNAANTIFTITISKTLEVGWYWLAFCTQGAAATNNFAVSTWNFAMYPRRQFSNLNGVELASWTQAGVAGAFATAVPVISSGTSATVFMRVA